MKNISIEIDGSVGEGGGQILRSSLALSMCTGTSFRIVKIRANRRKPGLMRQHLTAVLAAQQVCGADVAGAKIGSEELIFVPGPVAPGSYRFAVGTAGSATLVLQTVLPPLLCASGPSALRLEGGTHNAWAPPYHFLDKSFFPVLRQMGGCIESELEAWGFSPAGGGRMQVKVAPAAGGLRSVDLCERGCMVRAEMTAAVSRIPREIAEDECRLVRGGAEFPVEACRIETIDSLGPGNVAMLAMEFERGTALFTGFGELGVSRRTVAKGICEAANAFYRSGAAVEEHLADQLLIPMALAGGGSFTTVSPTPHTKTNIDIVRRFLDVKIRCVELRKGLWRIEAGPATSGKENDHGMGEA
ncbi:MAG TPA: RNA 3'-terminal phosphate cyclase [Candidatus Ozemobacteraceae bacterium]|nr:RNA 3'-terminal phosphate cyclase [Candidatus Ozemobacteraceae bacterium]HQG27726.1 RNA 3'-terminal phosphate cyclase [Candidatus Ozemobacteraceae bacterium]